MQIRLATLADLPALAAIEAACFPPAEAASAEQIGRRLATFPDHYWLAVDDELPGGLTERGSSGEASCQGPAAEVSGQEIIACIDGMCSSRRDLTDDLFADVNLHEAGGDWLMVCGVVTRPDRRGQGVARRLMEAVIADARTRGVKGLVLTCKEHMLVWYSRFGFINEGLSDSTHGGATWYQMRLML